MNYDIEKTRSKVSLVQRVLNELLTMLRQPEREGSIDYSPLFLILIPMVLGVQALVTEVEELLSLVYDRDENRERELSDALYERNLSRNDVERLTKEVKTLRDRLYPPPDPNKLTHRVKFMATGVVTERGSYKIQAIKQCRADAGIGLADAKNLVEGFIASEEFAYYKAKVERYVKMLRETGQPVEFYDSANRWHEGLEDIYALSDRVKFAACGAGSTTMPKILAIKLAREEKGLGLADAKNAVEKFMGSEEFNEYWRRVQDWLKHREPTKGDDKLVEAYATEWMRWLNHPKPLGNHESPTGQSN